MGELHSENKVDSSQLRIGSNGLGGTRLFSAFDTRQPSFTRDAGVPRLSLQRICLRTGCLVLVIGLLDEVVGFGNISEQK